MPFRRITYADGRSRAVPYRGTRVSAGTQSYRAPAARREGVNLSTTLYSSTKTKARKRDRKYARLGRQLTKYVGEQKSRSFEYVGASITDNVAPGYVCLFPIWATDLVVGNNAETRVGNKINVKSLSMNFTAINKSPAPIYVRCLILGQKNNVARRTDNLRPSFVDLFKQDANNTYTRNQSPLDINYAVNNRSWVKFNEMHFILNQTTSNQTVAYQDFKTLKLSHSFADKPHRVTWANELEAVPTAGQLVCVFVISYCDSTTLEQGQAPSCDIWGHVNMKYYDA